MIFGGKNRYWRRRKNGDRKDKEKMQKRRR